MFTKNSVKYGPFYGPIKMEESHSLIGSHLNGVFMWYIINFKWTLDTYIKKFCSSKVSVTFDEKTFYLGMKMVNYEEIIKIV